MTTISQEQHQFHSKEHQQQVEIIQPARDSNYTISPYAEQARLLEAELAQLKCQNGSCASKELQKELAAKQKQFANLKSQISRDAANLQRKHDSELKSQLKEQKKLVEQEQKVMKIAQNLAENQAEARDLETSKALNLTRDQEQAQMLADELAVKRQKERASVEDRINELLRVETEAKATIANLEGHRDEEEKALEVRSKDLEVKENVAATNLHGLNEQLKSEQNGLDGLRKDMEGIRSEISDAEDSARKFSTEIGGLEERIRFLKEEAEKARLQAGNLRDREAQQAAFLQDKEALIGNMKSRLSNEEHSIQSLHVTETSTIANINQEVHDAGEALSKARELLKLSESELGDLRKKLPKLVSEEQEAFKAAFDLQQRHGGPMIQTHEGTATVDVFQHSRVQVNDANQPELRNVNMATHVEGQDAAEAINGEAAGEGKGIIGSISDGIKNMF